MLYVSAGALEHCSADKKKIEIVCPEIWIHYIIDGAGYYNEHRLTEGDGFIVYKNDFCTYHPDRTDPWTYIWVRFSGEDGEGLLKNSGLPKKSGVFHFDYKVRLTKIAGAVLDNMMLYGESIYYRQGVARLILSLAMHARTKGKYSDGERTVALAREYIALNFYRDIKIEDMAKELYVDRKYLRNLFMRYEGVSTKEYLTKYRLERAKELLEQGDGKITAIARSVGYADPLAFCRIFKRRVGMSPTEYRSAISIS